MVDKSNKSNRRPAPSSRPPPGGEPVIKRSFLNALRLERERVAGFGEYPFCVPAIRDFERLEFHPAVTFFVGENGSGKSSIPTGHRHAFADIARLSERLDLSILGDRHRPD
jgi:hypothetical protein